MSEYRVLYVDDEDDVREVVSLSLALDDGLDVRACSSGYDALEEAPDWKPDIILLDVMMPGMDGPETFQRLRKQEATAHTPIMFITARTQPCEVESFLALGAVAVIPKPFDPLSLAFEVRHMLERHLAVA